MFKALELIEEYKIRFENAEKIYRDFSGNSKNGLTVTRYGNFVLVDDDSDKWIAYFDDYDDALEYIIKDVISGNIVDICDCYNDLCYECPAMYSRIGSGEYNKNLDNFVEVLKKNKVTDDQIKIIFEEIGEDLESVLTNTD
jgi:hypothetical protein